MSGLIPLWKCPKCGTAFKDLEEAERHLKGCNHVPVYRIMIFRHDDGQWLPDVELVHHSVAANVDTDVCRCTEESPGDFVFELHVKGKERVPEGVKRLAVYAADVVHMRELALQDDRRDILGIITLEEHTCRK